MKRVLAILLLSLSTAASASDLGGFAWLMKPKGTAEVGDDGLLGTRFDLEKDLGAGDDIVVPGGQIVLGNASALGFEAMQIEIEGENTITRDIQFRDLNFTARSRVLSELNATMLHGFLRVGVPGPGLSAGAEGGVVYADMEARAAAGGIGSASADAQAGMPYAGLFLRIQPTKGFVIKGSGRYSSWDINDYEVDYLDIEVSARIEVQPFFIGGGYRSLDLEVADKGENIAVDVGFTGPVVYAGLTW
jgi:hypothetical protein